jgi:hypothetical protein
MKDVVNMALRILVLALFIVAIITIVHTLAACLPDDVPVVREFKTVLLAA